MSKWLLPRNKRFPNERHATARHGLITNEMQQKLLTTNLIAPETSYIEASLTKLDFKVPIVLLLWEWKDTLSLLYASHTPPRIDVRKTRKRKRNTAWDLAFPEERGDAWTAESSRDSKAQHIFQFCFATNRCSSSGLIKDNCSCAWHPVDLFYAFCFLKCYKTTEGRQTKQLDRTQSSMANYGHPVNQEAPESDNIKIVFKLSLWVCVFSTQQTESKGAICHAWLPRLRLVHSQPSGQRERYSVQAKPRSASAEENFTGTKYLTRINIE